VRAITAANVADAVQRHLVPDTLSIIAVGNASGFAKGLEPFGTVSIVPLAGLDLTQPDLMAKTETAAGPEAGARGLKLIEAAAAAIGGADAIKTVKDSTTAGDVTLNTPAGEMNGKASATVEQPDKVKIVLSLPMGELVQVSDGTQSWIQVGGQPANALPAPMHAELQRSVVVSGGIGILREALDGRAEVAALESKSVEGTMLDRISWKKGDLEMVVGFDPQTHRIATVSYRGMTMQGPADSELRFSDYQKTENGLMVPMKTTTYQNGQKVGEVVVSEWKFNVGVPAGAFVK